MVISIKNISQKQGGNGGSSHSDYEDIIKSFGGESNIKSIKPKQLIVQSGVVIDSLQIIYNVTTEDGVTYEHTGNKCGQDGETKQTISLADDEQIIGISGRYGIFDGTGEIIKYLMFQTSKTSYNFGVNSPTESSFTLPAGVFFCSSDSYLDSLGTYEIAEVLPNTVTFPAETVTKISATTDVATSTITVDNSKNLAIGLGASGFGVATLVAIGAFGLVWKIKRSRNI